MNGGPAGATSVPGAFVHGVHVLAAAGAAAWLGVAVLVAATVGRPAPAPIRPG